MKKFGIGCGAIAGLLLVVAIIAAVFGFSTYNRLVGLSQNTDARWADVQNVYQRRMDLIPNLVKTVAGAANFEKSTLTEVTEARASVGQVKIDPSKAPTDPNALKQFQAAQDQLSSALSRLLVVVERYPELRATQGFRDLQVQLEGTENRISVERGNFNRAVQDYNTAVMRFPGMLFAGRFPPKPYFSAQAGAETAPKVEFDFGNQPATTNR
jgi:LemA protein